MADPSGPALLASLHAGERLRVAGEDRQAQVGPERLCHRARGRPAAKPRDGGMQLAAGHGTEVVVLDHERLRSAGQDRAQLA